MHFEANILHAFLFVGSACFVGTLAAHMLMHWVRSRQI